MGKPTSEIKDPVFWQEVAKKVAVGVHNTVVFWSPDIVILGGGLINSEAINTNEVKEHLDEIQTIFRSAPPVVRSTLGEQGGLLGALTLLKQRQVIT